MAIPEGQQVPARKTEVQEMTLNRILGFFGVRITPTTTVRPVPEKCATEGSEMRLVSGLVQIWAPFLPQSLAAVLPYPTMGMGGFQLVDHLMDPSTSISSSPVPKKRSRSRLQFD